MDFNSFKHLSLPAQAAVILDKGVFLSERTEDGQVLLLYGLENFYAEVYYHAETKEMIKLRSFHSTRMLDPYMEEEL